MCICPYKQKLWKLLYSHTKWILWFLVGNKAVRQMNQYRKNVVFFMKSNGSGLMTITSFSFCWKKKDVNPLTLNFEGITSFKSSEVALVVKNSPANAEDARDVGSIPGLGGFPGEGNGNPLQYSCLENSMDTGAWGQRSYRPWGHKESDTIEHTNIS